MKKLFAALAVFIYVNLPATIIPAARQIDWSACGVVGGIPTRSTISQTVSDTTYGNDSTAALSAIQTAINATASGQVCYIPPGIYRINGNLTLTNHNNITVRGAGKFTLSTSSVSVGNGAKVFTVPANLGYSAGVAVLVQRNIGGYNFDSGTFMIGTVTSYSGTTLTLNITSNADGAGSGTYSNWMVSLTVIKQVGTGAGCFSFGNDGDGMQYTSMNTYSTTVSSGATSGSTSIVVGSATGISTGQLLVVTELNNSEVKLTGWANTPTEATDADGWDNATGYTKGTRTRGQIVSVTGVAGTTITFTPALYTDYPLTAWVTRYFALPCSNSGIESMMLYATNSGASRNVFFDSAINCWMYDIYSNFTDGDHVDLWWSYRCEIRYCMFEDGFLHTSGVDTCVQTQFKTTGCLIADNIFKRLHSSIILEEGSCGNVVAYNYLLGEYDSSESGGNRALQVSLDLNHKAFPQFNLAESNITSHLVLDSIWGTSGDNTLFRNWSTGVATSYSPYSVRGTPGTPYTLNQGRYALDLYEGQYRVNAVGNILGNTTTTGGTYTVIEPAARTYSPTIYMVSEGYGSSSASGASAIYANPNATWIYHGNYDYVNQTVIWDPGIADHNIPNSLYLSVKPTWFYGLTWPAFDPTNIGTPLVQQIPAGYRYVNGIDPPAAGGTGGSATTGKVTVSGKVTFQ